MGSVDATAAVLGPPPLCRSAIDLAFPAYIVCHGGTNSAVFVVGKPPSRPLLTGVHIATIQPRHQPQRPCSGLALQRRARYKCCLAPRPATPTVPVCVFWKRFDACTVVTGVGFAHAAPVLASEVAPAPIHVRAGGRQPYPKPAPSGGFRSNPMAPRGILRIAIGVANTDRDTPTSPGTPRRGHAGSIGIGRSIPVVAHIRRIVETSAVHHRSGGRRHDRAVIPGGVACVNDIRRGTVHLDVSDVVQRGTGRN